MDDEELREERKSLIDEEGHAVAEAQRRRSRSAIHLVSWETCFVMFSRI